MGGGIIEHYKNIEYNLSYPKEYGINNNSNQAKLITPIITAFKTMYGKKPSINNISLEPYENLIPYVKHWSDGLLFFGTTGEFQWLDLKTRSLFLKEISKIFPELDKETELIINITPSLYKELINQQFFDNLKQAFSKARLLYQPGFNLQSLGEVRKRLKNVLDLSKDYGLKIYLYENPYNNTQKKHNKNNKLDGKNITLEELINDTAILKLMLQEDVLGIKDSRLFNTFLKPKNFEEVRDRFLKNGKQYLIGSDNLLEDARSLKASGVVAGIANAYPFIAFDALHSSTVDDISQGLIKARASGTLGLLVDSLRQHPQGYVAGLKLLMSDLIIKNTLDEHPEEYHIKLLEPVFIDSETRVLTPAKDYNILSQRSEQLTFFINASKTDEDLLIHSLKPAYKLQIANINSNNKICNQGNHPKTTPTKKLLDRRLYEKYKGGKSKNLSRAVVSGVSDRQ